MSVAAILSARPWVSSVWKTGQDSCRVIKQRLLEMILGVRIFLDVDDLEEIGDLEGYIMRSHTVLIYLSAGYSASKNVRARIRSVVSPTDCKCERRVDVTLNSL